MAFFKRSKQGSTSAATNDDTAKQSEQTAQSNAESDASKPEASSLWNRVRHGLKKTRDVLRTDIRDIFKSEGQLVDEEFLNRLFAILVKTDMGARPAAEIRDNIEAKFSGRVIEFEQALDEIRNHLKDILAQPPQPVHFAESGPTVILVVGVNGSGKTTSIAKLTHFFQNQGKKVVLGAADTFRAAAVEQLIIWSERLGAEIVTGEANSDPASVAHRTVATAIEQNADICIVDTAGRLQTQTNLMKQLEKIFRVMSKQIPEAPHEVFLVLDATAGQNGVSQAKGFSEAANCTGIILSKLDGTAKVGVIIPIRQEFEIPVLFVGQGEQSEDLAQFDADAFVSGLIEEDVA